MIVVYGWLKEKRRIKHVFDSYCYVCQSKESWELLKETEWVTFFGMRTIPFLSKDSLACGRCFDEAAIERSQAKHLMQGAEVARSIVFVEEFQLGRKSEVQRNFLLSMRAERERNTNAA